MFRVNCCSQPQCSQSCVVWCACVSFSLLSQTHLQQCAQYNNVNRVELIIEACMLIRCVVGLQNRRGGVHIIVLHAVRTTLQDVSSQYMHVFNSYRLHTLSLSYVLLLAKFILHVHYDTLPVSYEECLSHTGSRWP
jgi:hypothetical protein